MTKLLEQLRGEDCIELPVCRKANLALHPDKQDKKDREECREAAKSMLHEIHERKCK